MWSFGLRVRDGELHKVTVPTGSAQHATTKNCISMLIILTRVCVKHAFWKSRTYRICMHQSVFNSHSHMTSVIGVLSTPDSLHVCHPNLTKLHTATPTTSTILHLWIASCNLRHFTCVDSSQTATLLSPTPVPRSFAIATKPPQISWKTKFLILKTHF